MRLTEHRFLVAFLVSFILHGAVLSGSMLYANQNPLGETSDEIYVMSDVVEGLAETPMESKERQISQKTKKYVSQVTLVLLEGDVFKKVNTGTQKVASQIQDDKLKKEGKNVPISKNPATKPKLIKHSPVPYPAEANGVTGTVTVCFLVGYNGAPEYTSTAESSGNRFLDAAAVEHCISWRFTPARDSKGRLVRCLVYIPVTIKP